MNTSMRTGTALVILVVATGAILAACGKATPTVAPITATTPQSEPTPASVAAQGYDPQSTMFDIFTGEGHSEEVTLRALERAGAHQDISQVPVIIELMANIEPGVLTQAAATTLRELTGQEFGGEREDWKQWREWQGKHSAEYRPPEGYLRWKVSLLSLIDPRFTEFLIPHGQRALIDLTEVVWGGIKRGGIPSIDNPVILAPDRAGYLFPEDRVFGVSINGEHRAYPLRIVNAHEMVNDVLGGEPIALAY